MNTVAEKKHARLGPSGWDWWSNCPGAPALAQGQPRSTSRYAAEGSVAHEIADLVLSGKIADASAADGQLFKCEGYEFVVDTEMVEAVNDYVRVVHEFIGDGTLMPEQQVPIGHLTGEAGAEGTSDCIGITADGKRLIVIDLKYGKGVAVNAVGNGQGRIYALGALHKFSMLFEDIEEVEIVIVQPRLDSVSSEILTVAELNEFAAEVEMAAGQAMLNFAVAAEGNPLDLNPGEKQCKFCDAKGICPAIRESVSNSLSIMAAPASVEDFADLTPAKQASAVNVTPEVDVERLAAFMRAVPLIEEAIKGVRAEVERRLFAGDTVPGYYLGVGKAGNRSWIDEEAAAKALVRKLKKAGAYELKLLSPAKAEKALKKADPKGWSLIEKKHITQATGGPSVCREGDRNPVYSPPHSAIEDFVGLPTQSEVDALLG